MAGERRQHQLERDQKSRGMDLGVQNLSLSPAQQRQGKQQQWVERETDGELREGGWCQGEGEGVRGAAGEEKTDRHAAGRCSSCSLLVWVWSPPRPKSQRRKSFWKLDLSRSQMAAGPGKALAEGGDARLQSGVGSRLGASIFSPTPILIPLFLLRLPLMNQTSSACHAEDCQQKRH